ncbi:MAG: transketolase [Anaerolineaceae bacterium]|nr:transketolase [Anaerolineaceae bacterium]
MSATTTSFLRDVNLTGLKRRSIAYRREVLSMIFRAKAGHTGGSLSCVDILNVLYNCVMDITPDNFDMIDRDHYIQSKGHAVEALYAVLMDQGFFPASALETMETPGSDFIGHPTRKVPGIEHNTGALGHGLPFAVGMALAAKLDGRKNRVFVLLGDGELAEGSVWEGAMSAAHYHLDHLVVIIDRNRLQITAGTEDVMALEPLAQKFASFGFAVREVDGHNLAALCDVFGAVPFEPGKPNLVLANTIKGKGVSFMENDKLWHHHVPGEAEYQAALTELLEAQAELEGSDDE